MSRVEDAFRVAWPTLVASTARLVRDLDLAEDCAQEAIERALSAWGVDGAAPPANPTAWLTTTAHRIAVDRLRREATLRRKLPLLVAPPEGAPGDVAEDTDLLGLVFTCCHPALERTSQVALTLRLVCGLDVPAIAAVLLASEAAIAKRITRAKRKIAAARIPFRVPPADERGERLDAVLTVVHLVHTAGHADVGGAERVDGPQVRARQLARLLVRLLPGEPEAQALLGLVLLTDARGPARLDPDGELVLLPDQDRASWDRRLVSEGLARTTAALGTGTTRGRFALQAAVAGLHAVAPSWDRTDWAQVVATYDALVAVWPSPVVVLNRAVARTRLPDPDLDGALLEIDSVAPHLAGYRYLPVARAHVLDRLGRERDAAAARAEALALTTDPAERRLLARAGPGALHRA